MEIMETTQKNALKIAIVGLGSAGRSRLKAVERYQYFKLAGLISRRLEVATLSWDKALADPQIHAICICTENSRHEKLAQEALKSGKHVLCEYPAAFTQTGILGLLELAHQQNLILHIPPIALLSSSHIEAKQKILSLGKLENGRFTFTASATHMDGPLPFLTFPRLVQIGDFFGEFTIKDWQQESNLQGITFKALLKMRAGGILNFEESHLAGLQRSRSLITEQALGKFTWDYQPKMERLFIQDLKIFFDRITQGAPCYYDTPLLISITSELERVSQ